MLKIPRNLRQYEALLQVLNLGGFKKTAAENNYFNKIINNDILPSCMLYKHARLKENHLGPVVQSMVSLTSLLRGQLVKCL